MPTSNSEDTASINVDPNEVAKFEQLASRWWDRNSEFKPLHDINPLRANWIDKLAPVAEQKVLDVGCGGGILCEAMAQRGADVIFETCTRVYDWIPSISTTDGRTG